MQILNDFYFLNNKEREAIIKIINRSDTTIYNIKFKVDLHNHLKKHNFISQKDYSQLQDIARSKEETQFLTDLFFEKGIKRYLCKATK